MVIIATSRPTTVNPNVVGSVEVNTEALDLIAAKFKLTLCSLKKFERAPTLSMSLAENYPTVVFADEYTTQWGIVIAGMEVEILHAEDFTSFPDHDLYYYWGKTSNGYFFLSMLECDRILFETDVSYDFPEQF